ncbi:transglutaminaseTgpA domain-containing protein [Arthrobacter sp. zg-Y1171]|uniref:transglutaminaseTgpA domain-containing protein n=1 Tax=Arthrobacter sp. zg-Y1171 TaxID=2964610 RepID=UPI0021050CD6|nr:transglutaminaseTgpA domain-containing protein [Arthrobacter sp. zg-Y1171]MCQ1996197.1 transglutaminaseTgpA domain-containing protein [Arthrobacter sp. zg-Y1171]UWX82745.1 transglutaminaseTgpA domain-containing protein [Arthrobacter sp. zg-Y1171]
MSTNVTGPKAAALLPRLADWALLTAVLTLGILGFGPTFGWYMRFLVAGIGGILLGLGLAEASARLRWGFWATAGAAAGTYVLLGSAFAAPLEAIAGIIPSFASVRVLVLGIVFAWKDLLTIAPPVGLAAGMLVVPFLLGLIGGLVAGLLAWRARRPYWVLAPVLAVFVAGIALGTDEAPLPGIRGAVLIALTMPWLAYRRELGRSTVETITLEGTGPAAAASAGEATRRNLRSASGQPSAAARAARARRLGFGAAVLAAALAASLGTAPLLDQGTDRRVLRDVVEPPVDLFDYPSPLTDFRRYVKDESDTTLFTVEGLPEGQRIRLAALDAYDGVVYTVDPGSNGNFTRVGDARSDLAQTADEDGTKANLKFTVGEYSGAWVPAGGQATGFKVSGDRAADLAAGLYYSEASGTALTVAQLQPGDTYEASVLFPEEPDDAQLAKYRFSSTQLPRVYNDPPILGSKAADYVGDESRPVQRVRRLQQILASEGFFSNGKEGETPSLPGHGAARMLRLMDADQMVGDDEQYAVAMALMARKLGIPARVVMGFYPDWDEVKDPSAPLEITGDDVHAWVEVEFEHVGWVPFFPTPDEDNEPVPPQQQPKSTPKPQVLQPPPPPQEPAELPPDTEAEAQDPEEQEDDFWATFRYWLRLVALASLPLVILLGPLLLILLVKVRRRRSRRKSGTPSRRVGGGWKEVVSLATDLGSRPPSHATRREHAALLQHAFPVTADSTALLARRADAGIFGPGEPSEAEVEEYWKQVEEHLGRLAGSVGFWRRQRARYSPRSLLLDARMWTRRLSPGRWALPSARVSKRTRKPDHFSEPSG